MNNFKYYTPTKVFFGKDEEKRVGEIIKSFNLKKVLVHFGQVSVIKSGLLEIVLNSLKENNIEYITLGGVEPNPKLSMVLEGIKICKKNKIDLILAVGGGSVIDSAKSIAHGSKTDTNPWKFNTKEVEVIDSLPVGCILTLSAAGSEMSQSCVISNEETLEKRGFNSEFNRPLFAIENPELTYSVSPFQTGCGIVDIMMHTLERYFAKCDELIISDYFAEGLVKATMKAGTEALKNPNDFNARGTLMWASSLSHNDITGVGRPTEMPVHQIEHEISGMFDFVAHGTGLSAIYCSWARFVYKENIARFARFAYEVFDVDKTLSKEEASIKGIDLIEEYFKSIQMPTSLTQLNIPTDDKTLETLANNFTFKGTRVINDFKKIGYEEALQILKLAK